MSQRQTLLERKKKRENVPIKCGILKGCCLSLKKILISYSKYRLNEKIPRAREFFRAHSRVLVARNEEAYLPSEE